MYKPNDIIADVGGITKGSIPSPNAGTPPQLSHSSHSDTLPHSHIKMPSQNSDNIGYDDDDDDDDGDDGDDGDGDADDDDSTDKYNNYPDFFDSPSSHLDPPSQDNSNHISTSAPCTSHIPKSISKSSNKDNDDDDDLAFLEYDFIKDKKKHKIGTSHNDIHLEIDENAMTYVNKTVLHSKKTRYSPHVKISFL